MQKSIAERAADNIRVLSATMVEKAASGHPGGAMGGADFIQILYSEFLKFDPDDHTWPFRDRFYLDPGHMSAMLYSQLALIGALSIDDLKHFRQWKSVTPGHPEIFFEKGIENTSGPLGLGHAFGAGSAIAEAFLTYRFGKFVEHYTYIYISDGGIQEEISQGVGRIAGFLGLGKIIMFYDANDVQLSTMVDEVMTEDTAKKYESWHWHVITIDGNDEEEIRNAIRSAQEVTDKPSLIIGKTIMGKGAVTDDGSSYEGQVETHGKPLGKSSASYKNTIKNLGGTTDNSFEIFEDVQKYYDEVLEKKRKAVNEEKKLFEEWEQNNPELATQLNDFLSGHIPAIDWESIALKENDATRNASAKVLSLFGDEIENMIVASADLCNSDKTEAFLKKTGAFKNGDFSGRFFQAGVSELTMAAMCTGMALHGGVIPVCATFFAFSDYMKPVLRIAALMEQPVKFLWTHDAFRVGEDGPTHQPIEQEVQLRLLEKLHNHSGKPSFVALRPADSAETVHAWRTLLHTTDRPGGLILSRQNIDDITCNGSRFQQAEKAEKGAYIVRPSVTEPKVVLIANGSEVSTLMGAVELLDEQDSIQVVSIPSEGIFRTQTKFYQEQILPPNTRRFGLTAGLSINLEGLVGNDGKVYGLNHFGYSAPYQVLNEKFGFTPENIAKEIKEFLANS